MKQRRRIVKLFIAAHCALFSLAAQGPFTLADLVQEALLENYQVQIVRKQEQMAANSNTTGNAGMLPSVALRADRSWSVMDTRQDFFSGDSRSGANARSTFFSTMAEVNWVVFDGFSMFANRDRLSHLAELGKIETRYYIEQTVADLAHLYYQLVAARQYLDVYKQMLQVSGIRLILEEQRRLMGGGSALRYHQAFIDYQADSTVLENQAMLIRDLQIQLNRIVNRKLSAMLEPFDKDIPIAISSPVENLVANALQHNAGLERARAEELLAEAIARIESGNRYPQLSLFSTYGITKQANEVGFLVTSQQYGLQAGIRVRFNLYDGGKQTIRYRNSLLEKEVANIGRHDQTTGLEAALVRLANRHEGLMVQHGLLVQSLETAEKSMEILRNLLNVGSISGYEFRHGQLTVFQVQHQLIQLALDMKMAEVDIYRISGQLLQNLLPIVPSTR